MIAEIATMVSAVLVFVLTSTVLISTAMAVSYGAQFVSSSLKSALCASAIISCEKSPKPIIQGDKARGA